MVNKKIMRILKKIYNRIFPTIIALSALSVSASAAFYSVTGLSKLFAGASLQVLIMAGSLEVSKLVIASLLYRYWSDLNNVLRTYLTVATGILVLITSVGIYGFLSAAYQETASQSLIVDRQINILTTKKNRFEENLKFYSLEKEGITESIEVLRKGLTDNKIQYIDRETGQLITTTSSTNRRVYQQQLDDAINRRDDINKNIESLTDSLTTYDIKILTTEMQNEAGAELGPLKYISQLTGVEMDQVVNYLLLIIIFVFDPLAISLVITANYAFMRIKDDHYEDSDLTSLQERDGALNEMVKNNQEMGLYEDNINTLIDDNNEDNDGINEMYFDQLDNWLDNMEEQKNTFNYDKTNNQSIRDVKNTIEEFESVYDEDIVNEQDNIKQEDEIDEHEYVNEEEGLETEGDVVLYDENTLDDEIKQTNNIEPTPLPRPRRAGFLKIGDKLVNRNIRYRNV